MVHTFSEYLTRRWSRGPIGVIAAIKGRRPGRLWSSARATLVATLPDLDPAGRREQPAMVTYTGPAWPAGSAPPAPAALDGQHVLVSLSTVHYNGQDRALQSMIAAALQEQGAARIVVKSAAPDHIRTAIEDMLRPGPHRHAAARLGASIRARNGASVAADLITSVAANAA